MSNSLKSVLMLDDAIPRRDALLSNIFQPDYLHLLVPIKEEKDILYGTFYAKRLMDKSTPVTIDLLHVIEPIFRKGDIHPILRSVIDEEEFRAVELLNEASQHLRNNGIGCNSYIRHGDVAFAILDAAEMFESHAIVLPEMKQKSWRNLFSYDVVRSIVNSSRSVPVVLVDAEGMTKVWRN